MADDYIATFAASRPDALALADPDRTLTWAQFASRRDLIARVLQSMEIGPGDSVALYEVNSADYFVVSAAIQAIGAVVTQVNWRLTAEEIAYVLDNSDAVAVFVNEQFLPIADAVADGAAVREWIVLGSSNRPYARRLDDLLAGAGDLPPVRPAAPGGSMIYTGGTTGRQKGVRRNDMSVEDIDPAVFTALGAFLHAMRLDLPHRHLVTAALYHQGPIGYASGALRAGGSVVIMSAFERVRALGLIVK
jgi:long-chain acyl-CoA synthetase